MFDGSVWLIYGKLGMSKAQLKDAIVSRGGRVVGSISRKLDYLLWTGETLIPGDEVDASKPSKMLEQGGLVVGEADFMSLLEGRVPEKIQGFLDGRGDAASAEAAPKKTNSDSGSTPDALLERTRSGVGRSSREGERVVCEAVEACVAAGRTELAAQLARALPEALRGPSLVVLAAAGHGSTEEAVDAAVAGYESLGGHDREQFVSRLAFCASRAKGAASEAGRLSDCVERAYEEILENGSFGGRIESLLAAELELGETDVVRERILRANAADPDFLSQLSSRSDVGFLQVFADAPETALSLLPSMSPPEDHIVAAIPSLAGWADEHIAAVAAYLKEGPRTQLGQALVEDGRMREAQEIVFSLDDASSLQPSTRAERLRLTGDVEGADAVLRAHPELFAERVERGIESIGDVLARLDAAPDESMAHAVKIRLRLARFARTRDAHDAVGPILESITVQLRREASSRYDISNEASVRGDVALLEVEDLLQKADPAAVRAKLEADLRGLKALQDIASAAARDASGRTRGKNRVVQQFVHRAGVAGQLDLVQKAAKKISKKARPDSALSIASWFLPGDPSGALDALQASDGEMNLLRPARMKGQSAFFVRLWSAALGA